MKGHDPHTDGERRPLVKMVECIASLSLIPILPICIVKGQIYTVVAELVIDPENSGYELAEPSARAVCPCCGCVCAWDKRLFRDIGAVEPVPPRAVAVERPMARFVRKAKEKLGC